MDVKNDHECVCISNSLLSSPVGSTSVFIPLLQNANSFQVVLMPLVKKQEYRMKAGLNFMTKARNSCLHEQCFAAAAAAVRSASPN